MKRFLGTFGVCLVLGWAFLFFEGALIFENIWALLVFSALVLTILILLFEGQDRRIEELEVRVQALEELHRAEKEETL